MMIDKLLRSILGKKILGIVSFISVEVIVLGTFQTIFPVF